MARSVQKHGDGVAVVGLRVPDAAMAYLQATARGAASAQKPREEKDDWGVLRTSAVKAYGDTVIRFVERDDYAGVFAPGFQPRRPVRPAPGVGLTAIDHVVGNVELGAMEKWTRFLAETMGFTQLVHFDDKAISTE